MRNPLSKPDIQFADDSRLVYQRYPVLEAKKAPLRCKDSQINSMGAVKFHHCPGMSDMALMGYIIPAHTDIKIIANKAGTSCSIGGERGTNGFEPPVKMDASIVSGFLEERDDVKFDVVKVGLPWRIFTNKNVSCFLLPATYHSDFLDDLHIWPGVVDYKNFPVVNMIFSAKRKCSVHIKAGDPLLQVIPFINDNEMSATYGPINQQEKDSASNCMHGCMSQFYRKVLMAKKVFKLIGRAKNSD